MKWMWFSFLFAGSLLLPAAEPVWQEGEDGLWKLTFTDGSTLSARDFATNGIAGAYEESRDGAVRRRVWTSSVADVTVTEKASEDGVTDYRATVTPHGGRTSKMLDLPARLRFAPSSVKGFVYPGRGNSGIGMAFNEKFFLPSPSDEPTAWHPGKTFAAAGCRHLYGRDLRCLSLDLPATNLTVTADGVAWLGADAPRVFARWLRAVLRPPAKGQSDIVLVDSPNGPFLSGSHFGGRGTLWRFACAGESHRDRLPPCEAFALRRMLPRLAQKNPGRTRVALIALRCGPKAGGFVPLAVSDWRRILKQALPRGCVYEEIPDVRALRRATAASDTLLVVNPYGEYFPVEREADFLPGLDDVKRFVRTGGSWVEAGGYSFYRALTAGGFFSLREPYPPLFADFAHLTAKDGRSAAVYGVQPRKPHAPWKNPVPFVPGETGVGGDAQGGWYFHAFACYATDGTSVTTPVVRMRTGVSLEAALADYGRVNDLTRPLADKVKDPAKLDVFRRAPLFFLGGTAKEKTAALEKIPVPSLLHYSDYLKGGFDKEYPDHLPPRPAFGTPAELREFHDRARARGHLVSPYTNPTWWCDHPRGPSFIAAGEAPLAVGFDGRPYHEQYSRNDGWTITFWHSDVQKANRKTVREFTVDYSVDLLFQDQCGARAWRWDFNPASPSPTAYAEGIISMNEEDGAVVPLGTEDGWDRVVNEQTAVCGCTWRIVPVQRPVWRDLFKDVFPADSWKIEPVATRLFHDKALFYMHDLGSFVMNERTLAWMFAIGYQLSWRAGATDYLSSESKRAWYAWLQLLQDKVMSRIAGQPLKAFSHDRAPFLALPGDWSREEDDGVVTARYGDVTVLANLGDVPRRVGGAALAPYGWRITAPGLEAAMPDDRDPYIVSDGRRWEYRPTVNRPKTACALPPRGQTPRPRLAVIDLGKGVCPSWVKAGAADWMKALSAAPLVTRHGFALERLESAAAVKAALAKGPAAYFAILNPYGEAFPCENAADALPMLDAVRDYVRLGGAWVETGGASFYSALWNDGGVWRRTSLGLRGLARVGASVSMADIDEPAAPLKPAPAASDWFPVDLLERIAATRSQVNRAPADGADGTVLPLVTDGGGRVWLGCHRLGGWGCLWRLGGSDPARELALEVVPAALARQFEKGPPPLPPLPYRTVVSLP